MPEDLLKCPNCGSTDIRRFESVSYTQTCSVNADEVLEKLHPNEWCFDVDRVWCENCQFDFAGVDTLEAMNEKLKDVLTIPEIDSLMEEFYGGGLLAIEIVDSPEKAKELATSERGIIYTQVDSEVSDERVYSKGLHLVNRTGIYAVICQG